MTKFVLPLKLGSLANARLHWAARAKIAANQRMSAGIAVATSKDWRAPSGRIVISLTRVGRRMLDDDNLQAAFKHVRDGVADALGIDDGDKRLTWVYSQRTGKEYAVEIEIGAEHGRKEG